MPTWLIVALVGGGLYLITRSSSPVDQDAFNLYFALSKALTAQCATVANGLTLEYKKNTLGGYELTVTDNATMTPMLPATSGFTWTTLTAAQAAIADTCTQICNYFTPQQ